MDVNSAEIKFTTNGGIPMPSVRLQNLITKSVGKGQKDGELCNTIVNDLRAAMGDPWICFFGHTDARVNWFGGDEGIARFFLDGVKWIVLRSHVWVDQLMLNWFWTNWISVDESDELKKLKNAYQSLEKQLKEKVKEHDDYVKKINATKSLLEKILQLRVENKFQWI